MYDELAKMLRVCGDSNNSCGNCPIRENDGGCPHGDWEFAAEKYMLQAADAIEELSARVDRLQAFADNISKLPDCNTCLKKNLCEFMPKYGEYSRINCPAWLGAPEQPKGEKE